MELPPHGERLLDAASGPVQYPEYLEYHANFGRRVCVDISESALKQAEAKLGSKGEYVCASILELPLGDATIDAAVSLHTIYHIEKDQQEKAAKLQAQNTWLSQNPGKTAADYEAAQAGAKAGADFSRDANWIHYGEPPHSGRTAPATPPARCVGTASTLWPATDR